MFIRGIAMERFYPLACAMVITLIAVFLKFSLLSYLSSLPNIMGTVVTITSIFIGFLSTLAGILLSSNSKAIRFLKRIDKLSGLVRYIRLAIEWLFILLFVSFGLQLNPDLISFSWYISIAWVFIAAYGLLLSFRAVRCSMNLLLSISSNND